MRTVLGMAAVFMGVPLVCLGFLGMMQGCTLSHSEPEFSDGMVGFGMMALLFGSLLCWAAWKASRSDKE